MSIFNDLKYKYNTLDAFGKIIAINSVIFILGILIRVLLKYDPFQYFILPNEINDFIFQPWSLITYGFLHYGFFHLVFNMLFLFYLSRVITNLFHQKTVLNIYFLGIIIGGILFLVLTNLLNKNAMINIRGPLVGASAGVSALLLFVGTYLPESSIRLLGRFNVKWKYIAIAFVVYHTGGFLLGLNQGGNAAHLGGYLLGYYYALQLKKGNDIGKGFERLMDSVMSWFKPKSHLKTVHKTKKKKASYTRKSKSEFNTYNKQKRIDMILDKISKSGYESLTAAEKEFLFKAGQD